jgi:hypothetical protein
VYAYVREGERKQEGVGVGGRVVTQWKDSKPANQQKHATDNLVCLCHVHSTLLNLEVISNLERATKLCRRLFEDGFDMALCVKVHSPFVKKTNQRRRKDSRLFDLYANLFNTEQKEGNRKGCRDSCPAACMPVMTHPPQLHN